MAVAWYSYSRVTKSYREGEIWGVFVPIYNALYSIAFGMHTKTAEPIEMLFGMISGLGQSNSDICDCLVPFLHPVKTYYYIFHLTL